MTAENRLDDAVRKYQSVDGKSQFYIDALEETAWVFFKMRRFESSQVLLDVLIGNYESAQRLGNQKVSDSTYYRARYLKAYLGFDGEANRIAQQLPSLILKLSTKRI